MLDRTHIQKAINEAIALTEGVEEPFRSIAFREVLINLLRTNTPSEKPGKETIKHAPAQPTLLGNDRFTNMIQSDFEWSSLAIVNKDAITQNLMILKLALDKFKIDGLSAKDVQQILFQKYRISKSPNAISMSLMTAVGKYVDRIQEGKEFLYRITQKGLEKLEEKP
jgi:hypothetical protein